MRIPLELEHLIKAHVDTPNSESISDPVTKDKSTHPTDTGALNCQPTSLAGYLSVIESRKSLEVEHYLRACALRLDLTAFPSSSSGFD